MSAEYPIVAITGALESGSISVIKALRRIFYRERVKAVYIDGSAFRRYDRQTMREVVSTAKAEGRIVGHFGPDGNHLDKLENLFAQYAASGTGQFRHYLHTSEQASLFNQVAGTFSPWQALNPDSDLLLYRGLHGAAKTGDINIAQYPDLSIGMSPNANVEWMRKVCHDQTRGISLENSKASILERLHDYVHYITPQFMHTHINFQLIPTVDTSDPFGTEVEPTEDECYLIIHVVKKYWPDFMPLLAQIPGSFMTRRNTMVVPSSKMLTAIEVFLMPIIQNLIRTSRELRNISNVPKDRGIGLLGLIDESAPY